MQIDDCYSYDYRKIQRATNCKNKRGVKGRRAKHKIKNLWCAFDIETTRLPDDNSIMYIWQCQIEEDTIIGRTWEECKFFFDRINRALEISKSNLVIWVHNLAYEFQFLSGIFPVENVFSIAKRRVLKMNIGSIEFRCSYIHTNMSLDEFLQKMEIPNKKLHDFDYDKKRYPWTELTDQEMQYCINDVKGLVQALKKEADLFDDTIKTIPLTSTGYVRRDVKKAMQGFNYYQLRDQMPTYDIYLMLREAFRGGNTHANRYYANKILDNVKSADRVSSYPAELIDKLYPGSHFWRMPEGKTDIDTALDLIKKGKALLMRVAFYNIDLIDRFCGFPYLAESKCRHILNASRDNGRILEADYLETTITDVDLEIILDIYKWDSIVIYDLAYSRYRPLPEPLKRTVWEYFHLKTQLKNVEGQEILYMKSKNKLNACYGLSAQDPAKPDILYVNNQFTTNATITKDEFEKRMSKAFMSYSWAPWVTAWARYELHKGLMLAGENFVYCDTDSVKYIGDIDWSDYNENIRERCQRSGAFDTAPNGTTYYMGEFEQEKTMDRFITMGAKKYAYEIDGKVSITCAGVPKKAGAAFLSEHGGLEAFREGFIFNGKAGGLEAVYNDDADYNLNIDGYVLHVSKNVCLRESSYTLGQTADYKLALQNADRLINIFKRLKDE